MKVGILALQGAFREHAEILKQLGLVAQLVRLPEQLAEIDHLIIPGGESTTISKLLVRFGLLEPLRQRAGQDLALWGTCAGAILMARQIEGGWPSGLSHLGVLDIVIQRNGFGRQLDSFETDLALPAIGSEPLRGIFIRAPVIEAVGPEIEVLARLPAKDSVVAARQGRLLVTTFHPELTTDERLHRYFLAL